MDQLGKIVYKDDKLTYKYKGEVPVPPLEMVDDVVTLSECGSTSITMNSTVNTFMEHKRLRLNTKKCAKMHIGKKCAGCPKLQVHGEEMKTSDKEKYLGDLINTAGTTKDTFAARLSRGNAILVEIRSILSEIPLGTRRTEIGLALREAWFINGCLFNSEVWFNVAAQDVHKLETIDNKILRHILGAHSKVPVEFLHLETGTLNISSVMAVRRMGYLQTILKRPESELLRKVFTAMKKNPTKGDWNEKINRDFADINEVIDEEKIANQSELAYKNEIKRKVRKCALEKLNKMKENHSKIKHIKHEHLNKPQDYITSNKLNNKQTSLIFNLRSRCINTFKKNFAIMYKGDQNCPLCENETDTQEHALQCHIVMKHMSTEDKIRMRKVEYNHLFGTTEEQAKLATVYESILSIRERLLEESPQEPADQGIILDPTD